MATRETDSGNVIHFGKWACVIRLTHDQIIDISLSAPAQYRHPFTGARVVRIEDLQQFWMLFAGTM